MRVWVRRPVSLSIRRSGLKCFLRRHSHIASASHLALFEQQQAKFLGFPRDVLQGASLPTWLKEAACFSLINDGTKSKGLALTLSTLEHESDVIDMLAQRFCGAETGSYHGFLTNGGSMSNMEALLYARERFPLEKAFTCDRVHVSVQRACYALRMRLECTPAEHALGPVSIPQLIDALKANREHIEKNGAVIVLTQGYTFGGAEDDLSGFLQECARHSIPRQKMHIHVDAAFGGMFALARGFAQRHLLGEDYDSICISGQKFFGCPMPCSALLLSNVMGDIFNKEVDYIEYIKAVKKTISGSRNGWPALFLKYRLESQGVDGVLKSASECLELAAWLAAQGRQKGIRCHYFGSTPCVIFDVPAPAHIVNRYSLMSVGDQVQVICMPHVDKSLLHEFLGDLSQLLMQRAPSSREQSSKLATTYDFFPIHGTCVRQSLQGQTLD